MDRNEQVDTDGEEIAFPGGDLDSADIISPAAAESAAGLDDDESKWKNLPILAICFFSALSGLAAIIQPLATRLSSHPKLFGILNIYDYYHWSKMLSVAFGLLLILLSFNLLRKKKIAWTLAFYACLASAMVSLASVGFEYIVWIKDKDLNSILPSLSSILPILALVLLWVSRNRFTVRSQKSDISNSLFILLSSIAVLFIYATLGFWFLEIKDFGINFEIDEAFARATKELLFLGNHDILPKSRFGHWYLQSIHILEALAFSYAFLSFFRPIQYQLVLRAQEQQLAKKLLDDYGSDALDNYKLLPDKSYFFNDKKNAFVAFQTVLNTAICLGDPVGPEEELIPLIKSFRSYCHDNEWKIAFLQVKPDHLEKYKSIDLNVLKVGEDAIVELDEFASKTFKSKSLKSSVKKIEKAGFKLNRYEPPHDDKLVNTVKSISDEWLSLPGRRERGFSLGWFDKSAIQEGALYVLESENGDAIAFVNQVRSYAPSEVSIDMMRHVKDSPNGAMDYLFVHLMLDLHERGFKRFSLGLAALSGVGENEEASGHEKAVHLIYEKMNRFFSYKGLRKYKDKFKPRWEERFLIYEGTTANLIKTALAITRAGEIDV